MCEAAGQGNNSIIQDISEIINSTPEVVMVNSTSDTKRVEFSFAIEIAAPLQHDFEVWLDIYIEVRYYSTAIYRGDDKGGTF